MWARQTPGATRREGKMVELTREEAKSAFVEAIHENLELIGIDISTPEKRIELLKDLAWVRESRIGISLVEAGKDHEFIRSVRYALKRSAEKIGYGIILAVVAGVLYLAGLGEKIKMLQ